jgi:hypothetical protein
MSKHENLFPKSGIDEEVTAAELGKHLGVSRNSASAIATKFGLIKHTRGYRKLDIFRQIHGIEPMLLKAKLKAITAMYSENIVSDENDGPEMLCLIGELVAITDLAETLWDQGLVHIGDLAQEYGYAYDSFRKRLKSGSINLPPVRPIELSKNRVMYRPLDVVFWHRHGIVLDLPAVTANSTEQAASALSNTGDSTPPCEATSEAMTQAVFATAIAATDKKSGFSASSAPSADAMHEARL